MRIVTFTLDEDQVAWLRMKKDRYDVSMSLIIREILEDEIRNEAMYGETEYYKTRADLRRAHPDDPSLSDA